MPLIQLCAATINEPLIVYLPPAPVRVPVSDVIGRTATYGISCDMSHEPTKRLNNPIDLDVWLEQNALSMNDTHLSHRQILTKLGDTVGSHLDIYLHPQVQMLRSIKSGMQTDTGNQMIDYLLKVSEVTLSLCQHLLARR